MKGLVFTEFLDLVDQAFGAEVTEQIVTDAGFESAGEYTATGYYDHQEMLVLVTKLSETTGLPINDLVQTYGKYLLSRFVALYPMFFQDVPDCFTFLESIDNHIHVEVHKLYPDADLPRFDTKRVDEKTFEMLYRSQKPFGKLAHGLIEGALKHFGEEAEIEAIDQTDPAADLCQWTFKVTKV